MQKKTYLLVASDHDVGSVSVQDWIREDVEEELGGVTELLLDGGGVNDVDNGPRAGLVLVQQLHPETLRAGNVHNCQRAPAGGMKAACRKSENSFFQ